MKKLFFISSFLVCINCQLIAQEQLTFGIKAGANFAYAVGDAADSDSQIGYDEGRRALHVGFVSELKFSEKLSIQPELFYSQAGAAYRFDNRSFDGIKVESDLSIDYLSLPVLTKYYVLKGLSLEFGPQFSYVLNSKVENEILSSGFVSPPVNIFTNTDLKDDIHKFDLGLALGTSYKLATTGLFIQARYVLGLTDVPKNKSFVNSTNFRNAIFQLSLGYKF